MKVIKIELSGGNFVWSLGDIVVTRDKKISEPIDWDSLTDQIKKIINTSWKMGEIYILNSDNERLESLNEVKINEKCNYVDIEDIEEDNDDITEVQSITVSIEESQEEVTEQKEFTEDAKLFLSKNHHAVKKAIANLNKDLDEDFFFVQKCYELEAENKNRPTIIKAIKGFLNG